MGITPDDLRRKIPDWSLESDGLLLQYMVQISKNLESKCVKTQENLNQLSLDLGESQIRFANASNNFNGVQQVKYVENRVKDDDESFYSVREEATETGEKYSHADIFKMSVQRSITNMYKCFEKVTVQLDSDSDSDDDVNDAEVKARNTVLRAIQKYPYINRPLPCVIGSREWKEKWHAGLIDSEEESETECKEQYSDSSDSERIFPSQTNSNHTPSESEGSVWGVHSDPRGRAASMDPSVSGEDTLSIHSTSSSIRPPGVKTLMQQNKVQVLPFGQQFRPPSLFPAQPPEDTISVSSSRSKIPNLFEESDNEDSTPIHRANAQPAITQPSYFRGNPSAERQMVNLFDDEPPSPVMDRATKSQQKKSVNLFIESEDEEDATNNNNQQSKIIDVGRNDSKETLRTKLPANLFVDGRERENQKVDMKTAGNIFDEVNNNPSDEEDLFVPVQKSINGSNDGRNIRRITNLFDDEPPVDDFDEIFKSKVIHKPVGGKLVLPVSPVPPKTIDVNDKKIVSDPKAGNPNTPRDGLRNKSGENTPSKSTEMQKKIATEIMAKKKINLFDDEEDNQDIFSTNATNEKKSTTVPKVNLFDDDDDDSFFFGGNASNPEVESKSKIVSAHQVGTGKPTTSIRSEILKKKSIFDSDSSDENDEDKYIESTVKTKSATTPNTKTQHFPETVQSASSVQHSTNGTQSQPITSMEESVNGSTKVENAANETNISSSEILPPVDQEFPKSLEISNEIDYYLTTNEISGNPVESAPAEVKSETENFLASTENESSTFGELVDAVITKCHDSESNMAQQKNNEQAIEPQTIGSDAHNAGHITLVPQTAEDHASVAKCALDFSSMGLFDDVPPPDDNLIEEARSSMVLDQSDDHGFYTGQTSSQTVISSSSTNCSRYLFMDDEGPPPDDMNLELAKDEVDDRPSVVQIAKNISNIVGNDDNSETNQGNKREKLKINKLSTKVNINVNALLPGSRRFPTTEAKVDDELIMGKNSSTKVLADQNENTIHSKKMPESDDSANKLVGLNKDRVRIQAKRRPSSRKHRKAHYEDTLQANSSMPTSIIQCQQDTQTEEVRVVVGSEMKSQHVEITTTDLVVNPLVSNQLKHQFSEQKLLVKDEDDALFDSRTIETKSVESVPKKPFSSLLPSTEVAKPTEVRPVAAKSKQTLSTSKLFSDSETDEDDLFGMLAKHVAIPKAIAPAVVSPKNTSQSIEKPPSMSTKAVPLKTNQSKSIFGDSDDENDYLFSKPSSSTNSQPTPVVASATKSAGKTTSNKNKSIFGSDDEDESNNLFGSQSKLKSVVASVATGSAGPSVQTKSLFSDDDDDDDDDLFGSKRKTTAKSTPSLAGVKKPDNNLTKKSTTLASNDPLADLFGS